MLWDNRILCFFIYLSVSRERVQVTRVAGACFALRHAGHDRQFPDGSKRQMVLLIRLKTLTIMTHCGLQRCFDLCIGHLSYLRYHINHTFPYLHASLWSTACVSISYHLYLTYNLLPLNRIYIINFRPYENGSCWRAARHGKMARLSPRPRCPLP